MFPFQVMIAALAAFSIFVIPATFEQNRRIEVGRAQVSAERLAIHHQFAIRYATDNPAFSGVLRPQDLLDVSPAGLSLYPGPAAVRDDEAQSLIDMLSVSGTDWRVLVTYPEDGAVDFGRVSEMRRSGGSSNQVGEGWKRNGEIVMNVSVGSHGTVTQNSLTRPIVNSTVRYATAGTGFDFIEDGTPILITFLGRLP